MPGSRYLRDTAYLRWLAPSPAAGPTTIPRHIP
jgi:hypothetical protein